MSNAPHTVLLDELFDLATCDPDALARRVPGSVLLEVRTEVPLPAHQSRLTPSSRSTESYEVDLLLGLRRARAAPDVRVYLLHDGLTAGRGKSCELQLGDPAAALSKAHARFSEVGGRWHVTDLGSTNGTFVEEEPVRPQVAHPLRTLESLQLGDQRFVFLDREDLFALLTPIVSSTPTPVEVAAKELESLGSRRFMLRHEAPSLLIDAGSGAAAFAPQTVHPLVGDRLSIGRDSSAEICVASRSVSKQHARLYRKGSSWLLEDVGSSNGTEKDGVRLKRGERVRLVSWDSFFLGSSQVRALFLDGRGLVEFLIDSRPGRSKRGGR